MSATVKLTRRMVPFALIVVLFAVAGNVPATFAGPASDAAGLEFALIGDIPYGHAREPNYLNLIKDINQAKPTFTIHDGDIKSGSTFCSDELFQVRLEQFGYFEQPIVYLFGDNEWTDCHRANNGAYDPLEPSSEAARDVHGR